MSTPAPWGVPDANAPADPNAPACPPPQGPGIGTMLLVTLFAAGVVQWVMGRAKTAQEEATAAKLREELEARHFELEGAREDQEMQLAQAFARRPIAPIGMGGLPWGHR